ncbi:MAG: hypothetical protein NTW56_14205 [Alphaproteobacteria bacterium]|nr:hypothetical protein [Alphaproteobacteria bacterium]
MKRSIALFAVLILTAACEPPDPFVPSTRSAVELRAMQSRIVPGEQQAVMRAIAATLHDQGYRVTRADSASGNISATRGTVLRVSFVVQPRGVNESIVRGNATLLGMGREHQIDAPAFYQDNLFAPLSAQMQRDFRNLPDDVQVADAVRPIAELNTIAARTAAARAAAEAAAPTATPVAATEGITR